MSGASAGGLKVASRHAPSLGSAAARTARQNEPVLVRRPAKLSMNHAPIGARADRDCHRYWNGVPARTCTSTRERVGRADQGPRHHSVGGSGAAIGDRVAFPIQMSKKTVGRVGALAGALCFPWGALRVTAGPEPVSHEFGKPKTSRRNSRFRRGLAPIDAEWRASEKAGEGI